MLTWLWLAGVLVAIEPTRRALLQSLGTNKPDTFEQSCCVVVAVGLAALWPLLLLGYLAWRVSRWLWKDRAHAPH